MTRSHLLRRLLPLLAVAVLTTCGCNSVHRRLTIRSEPSGALVQVNGKRLGTTPVSTDFVYYGTYEIQLSKPADEFSANGYKTQIRQVHVNPPFYEIFPLEFFADNFLPFRVTDRHDYVFALEPADDFANAEQPLLERARGFRSQAQVGQ